MERCERCHDQDDPDIIEGMCFRHWVVSELLSISDQLAIIQNEEENEMVQEQALTDAVTAIGAEVANAVTLEQEALTHLSGVVTTDPAVQAAIDSAVAALTTSTASLSAEDGTLKTAIAALTPAAPGSAPY